MAVGLAASIQVAAVIPNFAKVEFFNRLVEPSKLFSNHCYEVEEDGCINVGNEPGLGVSIDEATLQSFDYRPQSIRQWPIEI